MSALLQQHHLVAGILSMLLCSSSSFTLAFQTQGTPRTPTNRPPWTTTSSSSLGAAMIGTMAPPSTQQSHQANFEESMRKLVTETETKVRQSASWSSSLTSGTSNNAGPAAIPLSAVVRQVKSLKEYTAMLKEVVVKEHGNVDAPITVVRFHSTYCPACKKSAPAYNSIIRRHLAQQQQQNHLQQQQQQRQRGINWVDVEANSSNLDLQQALGLKTIPTGLIYHPQAGLVEQMSFGKKNLKLVEETIQSYLIANECNLPPPLEAAAVALP